MTLWKPLPLDPPDEVLGEIINRRTHAWWHTWDNTKGTTMERYWAAERAAYKAMMEYDYDPTIG